MRPQSWLRLWTVTFALAACTQPIDQPPPVAFQHSLDGTAVPWTHEEFEDAGRFAFAIVSDLNGSERDLIFDVALAQLDLLEPELILSVGDLIDGASDDPDALHAEWDRFDERARAADAPLFRVSGNHDATAQVLRDIWVERYGALYYHFVYKDVLFLVLDTEDYTDARRAEIRDARDEALRLADGAARERSRYYQMPERLTGGVGLEQSEYMLRAIAGNSDVRWTLLFMHKPVWQSAGEPEFVAIEDALAGRPYTVFNGHFHTYSHTLEKGRDYIMLGTTGGGQNPESEMAFDHVAWVTMTPEGPSIAQLRLDGILDKTGRVPMAGDSLCFQASAGCG